jgi:plasmid stabilization system protein ParE
LRFRLTQLAEADIRAILRQTHRQFGPQQVRRYQRLLGAAVDRVATEPFGLHTRPRNDLGLPIRSFHVAAAAGRRSAAAHQLFFVVNTLASSESELVILRVLHERMDIDWHLLDALAGLKD